MGGHPPHRARASAPQQWFVLVGVAVLLVLFVLLVAISYWRHRRAKRQPDAGDRSPTRWRRGLTVRERQILLAIVMRSGLRRTPRHLPRRRRRSNAGWPSCWRNVRRPGRRRRLSDLKAEVASLRQKLGFAGGGGWRRRPVRERAEQPGHPGRASTGADGPQRAPGRSPCAPRWSATTKSSSPSRCRRRWRAGRATPGARGTMRACPPGSFARRR